MLDRTNYTTRTDISREEVNALVEVRTQLELDQIWIDMSDYCHCIGGHVAMRLKVSVLSYVPYAKELRPLYYPPSGFFYRNNNATTAQAITNFLNGSDDPWH